MRPIRVSGEGYRTFPAFELDFTEGVTAVRGDVDAGGAISSNGAGKSSLIMALELCLFGPESRSWEPYVRHGSSRLELTLEFEHAGETYRVRRGWSKGKPTMELEREGTDGWSPLVTAARVAETQAALEALLGFDRQTFRQSAVLAQHGRSLAELDARERKDAVARALRVDEPWSAILERARRDLRAAKDDAAGITGRLDQVDMRLTSRTALARERASADDTIADVSAMLDEAEHEHGAAVERAAQIQAAATAYAQRRREYEVARALLTEAASIQSDADLAAITAEQIESHLAQLPAADHAEVLAEQADRLRAQIAERKAAVAAHTAARFAASAATEKREELERQARELTDEMQRLAVQRRQIEDDHEHGAVCDRCGQALGAEALEHALASMADTLADLHMRATEAQARADNVEVPPLPTQPIDPSFDLERELAEVTRKWQDASDAATTRARLEERLAMERARVERARHPEYRQRIRELADDVARQRAELEATAPPDSAAADHALRSVSAALSKAVTLRDRLLVAREQRARSDALLEELDRVAEHAQADRARLAELQDTIADLELIAEACSRDGIPAWWTQQFALPQIEAEATRLLGELGTGFELELRSARELDDGRISRDELDVVILLDGAELDYRTQLSGGERSRVDIALRLALVDLLAQHRGAEIGALILDEVKHLDAAGEEAVVAILQGMRERFPVALLVSHSPDMLNGCDTVVTVTKDAAGVSGVVA